MNMEDGVMLVRKAEIDTRAPFRSVKEAVSLFGEKVLAGEVYASANKLKKVQSGTKDSMRIENVEAELEETRENLERAKEESMLMAHCLSCLEEELERTKQELEELKQRETGKFVEEEKTMELEKKRYVTFANTPSVSHVMNMNQKLERAHSLRETQKNKKKKKPLIPLIGGIFSRKKGTQEVA